MGLRGRRRLRRRIESSLTLIIGASDANDDGNDEVDDGNNGPLDLLVAGNTDDAFIIPLEPLWGTTSRDEVDFDFTILNALPFVDGDTCRGSDDDDVDLAICSCTEDDGARGLHLNV
jgi:hypothetical protein